MSKTVVRRTRLRRQLNQGHPKAFIDAMIATEELKEYLLEELKAKQEEDKKTEKEMKEKLKKELLDEVNLFKKKFTFGQTVLFCFFLQGFWIMFFGGLYLKLH